jgi:hypothetical protein
MLYRIVPEQAVALVKDKPDGERQLVQPGWRRLVAVEVDFGLFLREIVGIALKLESRPAADDDRNLQERLERYDCSPAVAERPAS